VSSVGSSVVSLSGPAAYQYPTQASLTVQVQVGSSSKCDVNQDGSTSVADVQLVINEALGVSPATQDLNGDGLVNVVDVQIVINAALGLGCSADSGP